MALARILGVVEGPRDAFPALAPFYHGPMGWLLVDVVPVVPIEIIGAQGTWKVPGHIARRLKLL